MHQALQVSASTSPISFEGDKANESCDELFLVACDRFCDPNNEKPLTARQFSEAFYLLIDQVSIETKQAVARAVANTRHTPRAIALYFAMESIDIAAPVLLHSKVLGQLDLLRIVESKKGEHAELISERTDLGRTVIDRLYALADDTLDDKLAFNESIVANHQEKSVGAMFASICGQLDMTAKSKVAAEKVDQENISKPSASHQLLQAAARGKRLKTDIQERVEQAPTHEISGIQDFGDALERAARLGSRQSIGVLLSKYLNLELETSFQILEDKSGDTLVVALKSHDISSQQCSRILMLAFPEIGLSVHNAQRSIMFFDQITIEACKAAVAQWPKQENNKHETVLMDTDDTRAPRDTGVYQKDPKVSRERQTRRSA